MKKLLLILLCLPMIGFGQFTMIPDANFEQILINLGYDSGAINGSVYTAIINTVTSLDVSGSNISDLTGIEDFTALTDLSCQDNQLTSLDVSQKYCFRTT
jgi:Leucine-rich repeat (LRR) protein